MESLMQSFKEYLNAESYDVLEKIVGYIDTHYVMDVLFDGIDEVKFRRSGRTLLTIYLRGESIVTLIIFGKDERRQFEMVQESFSEFIQKYYTNSRTYHDGKWMYIELCDDSHLVDVLRLIQIKRKPNPKVITMCGYRCDLCKAYYRNIRKDDQRAGLSLAWRQYYGLNIGPSDMYCDGCRSSKRNAERIDHSCPVRRCVLDRGLGSCADCLGYPCEVFVQREGLCFAEAAEMQGERFNGEEFDLFLRAFDNKTRLNRLRETKRMQTSQVRQSIVAADSGNPFRNVSSSYRECSKNISPPSEPRRLPILPNRKA